MTVILVVGHILFSRVGQLHMSNRMDNACSRRGSGKYGCCAPDEHNTGKRSYQQFSELRSPRAKAGSTYERLREFHKHSTCGDPRHSCGGGSRSSFLQFYEDVCIGGAPIKRGRRQIPSLCTIFTGIDANTRPMVTVILYFGECRASLAPR